MGDLYLNFCLLLLNVTPIWEPRLLQDAFEWGSHAPKCTSGHAVFHPLKSIARWKTCMNQIGPNAIKPPHSYEAVLKHWNRGALDVPLAVVKESSSHKYSRMVVLALVLLVCGALMAAPCRIVRWPWLRVKRTTLSSLDVIYRFIAPEGISL